MTQQPTLSTRKPSALHGKREDTARRPTQRIVLCLGDWPRTAILERLYQERGWKVHLAASGTEARQLVLKHGTAVVLLHENPASQESGWLTCWKLLRDRPSCDVVLLGGLTSERGKQQAAMVGAADYLPANETAAGIAHLLHERGIAVN